MAQVTLDEFQDTLTDVQDTESFDFILFGIPGATVSERHLAIQCQQAEYPGREVEPIDASAHGQTSRHAGRATYTREMSVTYIEGADLEITKTFGNWFEAQRGTISGTSLGYKADVAIQALLIKYDTAGKVADQVRFFNTQPLSRGAVQLDGSSSNLWLVTMSFMYDWPESDGVTLR